MILANSSLTNPPEESCTSVVLCLIRLNSQDHEVMLLQLASTEPHAGPSTCVRLSLGPFQFTASVAGAIGAHNMFLW
jgi:hypothetical protein